MDDQLLFGQLDVATLKMTQMARQVRAFFSDGWVHVWVSLRESMDVGEHLRVLYVPLGPRLNTGIWNHRTTHFGLRSPLQGVYFLVDAKSHPVPRICSKAHLFLARKTCPCARHSLGYWGVGLRKSTLSGLVAQFHSLRGRWGYLYRARSGCIQLTTCQCQSYMEYRW